MAIISDDSNGWLLLLGCQFPAIHFEGMFVALNAFLQQRDVLFTSGGWGASHTSPLFTLLMTEDASAMTIISDDSDG